MNESVSRQDFAPYIAFFPRSHKGVMELELQGKWGKVKPGIYLFVETYCATEDCDCRQVVLQVINEKQRTVAVIDFPLDIDHPFLGPCLNGSVKQAAAAEDFLEIFVESLIDMPDWYRGMCQRYRSVRKKIDGTPYCGDRFPSKKYLRYLHVSLAAEESPGDAFHTVLESLLSFDEGQQKRKEPQLVNNHQKQLFDNEELLDSRGIVGLVNFYTGQSANEFCGTPLGEKHLRPLLQEDQSADELIAYLVELYRIKDEKKLDAALLLMAEVMDVLRTDLERRRPLAETKMELWQEALAQHIFNSAVDPELGAEITRILLNARVDILPQLHQANTSRMFEMAPSDGYPDVTPEFALEDLLSDIDDLGITSPFEMVDALLQMMAIGSPEIQLVMCEQMFYSDSTMAREAAALMLFHPHEEVREQVADFLAVAEGEFFTPVILRRLIVSRNWFPQVLRKKLDQAIAHARRARVECAPLNKPAKVRAYASAVDGANAQSLQIVIPWGKGFLSCSTMPKKGFGMADSFLLELENKKHLQEFLQMLKFEAGGLEVSIEYIDERVCQVLADGSCNGKVPNHWLVAIAEQLGRDNWKAVPLDVANELESLKVEMQRRDKGAFSTRKRQKALQESSFWPKKQHFANSWFEDDCDVDEKLNQLFLDQRYDDVEAPINLIINEILELRRTEWLERLVLTSTWLKAAKKPPVSWEKMCHVAMAVADIDTPLKKIPLMSTIAEHTVGAYLSRLDSSADT